MNPKKVNFKFIKLSDHFKILLSNIICANLQIGFPTIPH